MVAQRRTAVYIQQKFESVAKDGHEIHVVQGDWYDVGLADASNNLMVRHCRVVTR